MRKQRQEQQRRHEEQLCHALRVWNTEILPNWDLWLAASISLAVSGLNTGQSHTSINLINLPCVILF